MIDVLGKEQDCKIGEQRVRIVDKAFPAQRCPGFFKVNTHNDMEVFSSIVRILLEKLCILDRSIDIVHRAWARHA